MRNIGMLASGLAMASMLVGQPVNRQAGADIRLIDDSYLSLAEYRGHSRGYGTGGKKYADRAAGLRGRKANQVRMHSGAAYHRRKAAAALRKGHREAQHFFGNVARHEVGY